MVIRKNAFYLDRSGHIDSKSWLHHLSMQRTESKLRLVRHALALSQLTGEKVQTPFGKNCLQQGLVMADLLLDLSLDEETICAALVYNSFYYAELSKHTIADQLNENVAKLLAGVLKMGNVNHFPNQDYVKHKQLENFRKMLLVIADDMRVVLIKLVERIACMRAYQKNNIRNIETRQCAKELLMVYAPLANRLGVNTIRYELEDLAMKQLAPALYKKMATVFNECLLDRENYVSELALAFEIALSKLQVQNFKIFYRIKNFYGTYLKMYQRRLSINQIHDLNAIRIIVDNVESCYKVLHAVKQLWTTLPNQFADYIKYPKNNHYQSIHLAICGENQKTIEIQIRTFEMHQASEHGVAAHWQYKEGVLYQKHYQSKIAWLRQLLIWQKELVQNRIHVMPELMKTLDDRVYIFSISNEIFDLPKGATALDFAYFMHTDMGNYCHRIEVNGVEKPLTHVLSTGEKVKVFTSQYPNLHWNWLNPHLGYLNTAKAKADVLHWFRKKNYHQHIIIGQLLLEKECQKLGLHTINQEKVAQLLSFSSQNELLAALGSGELKIVQVLHTLYQYNKKGQASLKINPDNNTVEAQNRRKSIYPTSYNEKYLHHHVMESSSMYQNTRKTYQSTVRIDIKYGIRTLSTVIQIIEQYPIELIAIFADALQEKDSTVQLTLQYLEKQVFTQCLTQLRDEKHIVIL